MPVWGQVELLCRAIREEGQREAEELLSRAEGEARQIIVSAKESVEKKYEEEVLARRSTAHAEARRMVDSAELEARRRIMAFREQVVREVITALDERLRQFRKEPSYGDFLMAALMEGVEQLSGEEFIAELSDTDFGPLADQIREYAGRLSVKVEVEPSASILGGVRVYTMDRRRLYDNSLPARLRRFENDIRREVGREIFETQGKQGE